MFDDNEFDPAPKLIDRVALLIVEGGVFALFCLAVLAIFSILAAIF